MIIIFSGPDYPRDPQIDYLREELASRSLKSIVLNPFKIEYDKIKLIQKGGKINFVSNGKELKPSVIYLSARWRSDSLVSIPGNTTYPNVFRSQIAQFIEDFRFAFEGVRWVPGKQESIERADSKPCVMAYAAKVLITNPLFYS